jgi:heme exporter protein CcmD
MGGYGPYVWSCFGLTAAVLVFNLVAARRELETQLIKAKRRAAVDQRAES